jgi:hypothetical protein
VLKAIIFILGQIEITQHYHKYGKKITCNFTKIGAKNARSLLEPSFLRICRQVSSFAFLGLLIDLPTSFLAIFSSLLVQSSSRQVVFFGCSLADLPTDFFRGLLLSFLPIN